MKEAEEIQESANIEPTETEAGANDSESSQEEATQDTTQVQDAKENQSWPLATNTIHISKATPESLVEITDSDIFESIVMEQTSKSMR